MVISQQTCHANRARRVQGNICELKSLNSGGIIQAMHTMCPLG